MTSFLDLPWEDIIIDKIFPKLALNDLRSLRKVSVGFLNLIDLYLSQLKHLPDFGRDSLIYYKLLPLATKFNNLDELDLSYEWADDKMVDTFLRSNNAVTKVNFSHSPVSGVGIHPIINCQNVKQLILRDCRKLTTECITTLLFHLEQLEFLDLTDCYQIEFTELMKIMSNSRLQLMFRCDRNSSDEFSVKIHYWDESRKITTKWTNELEADYGKDWLCMVCHKKFDANGWLVDFPETQK